MIQGGPIRDFLYISISPSMQVNYLRTVTSYLDNELL